MLVILNTFIVCLHLFQLNFVTTPTQLRCYCVGILSFWSLKCFILFMQWQTGAHCTSRRHFLVQVAGSTTQSNWRSHISKHYQSNFHRLRSSEYRSNVAIFQRLGLVRGAGHFGHKTLRHRDNSAPQNWCWSLRRITGGGVSHRNCPGSKCPGFSSITALVSKCLVPRFWCRSVLRPVPKCPRVSWGRSVLWPKCPVTATDYYLGG